MCAVNEFCILLLFIYIFFLVFCGMLRVDGVCEREGARRRREREITSLAAAFFFFFLLLPAAWHIYLFLTFHFIYLCAFFSFASLLAYFDTALFAFQK